MLQLNIWFIVSYLINFINDDRCSIKLKLIIAVYGFSVKLKLLLYSYFNHEL